MMLKMTFHPYPTIPFYTIALATQSLGGLQQPNHRCIKSLLINGSRLSNRPITLCLITGMAVQFSIDNESEHQARLRIVHNAFKERNNCIVLRVDTCVNSEKGVNPFGFHFEFDRSKYEENKERKKREAVTRWLALAAFVHHKLGIRHVLLVLMMSFYAILGGFVFDALEADNERNNVASAIHDMNIVIDDFVDLVVNVSLTQSNETVRDATLAMEAKKFYKDMLLTEDRYLGSAWHKAEDLTLNVQWTFWSALFYSFTVFSTVGYGSIACSTYLGRYVSILYACIGIPLMLLTIGDLGKVLQRWLCNLHMLIKEKVLCCWRKNTEKDVEQNQGEDEDDEDDEMESYLPVWIAVTLFFLYVLIIAVYLYYGDMVKPQNADFDFATAFYFSFVSMSTIGFGDVMPNSIEYFPLTPLAFLFGLVLISIINSSVYSQLYETFYTGVMSMEATLDAIHADSYETSGHKLFKKLAPAFTMLSLSFPSTEFSSTKNNAAPLITFTPPTSERSSSGDSKGSQAVEERSRSITLVEIPGEVVVTRNKRALSEEPRPRAHSSSTTSPGTFGTFKYFSRLAHPPALGALGGVAIATANRKRILARISKNCDQPC